MNKILDWINGSPIGVAIKVGVAAMLAYVLAEYVPQIDPILVVGITPILVAVIDFLNPANDRFGVTRSE